MASALAPSFYEFVRMHAEQGVALNEMTITDEQRLRINVCMNTWQRLQENPGMNIERYLQKTWKRTYSEIVNDKQVVNFLVKLLGHEEKAMIDFRARRHAERFLDMAASQGDVKNGVAALGIYQKITHAGEEEKSDNVSRMILPPVLVQINQIDPSKPVIETKELRKLRRKYNAVTDKIQEMVENREGEYEAMDAAAHERQQQSMSYQERINDALDAGDYELAGKIRTEMRNNTIAMKNSETATEDDTNEDSSFAPIGTTADNEQGEDERLAGIMQNYFGEDEDIEDE